MNVRSRRTAHLGSGSASNSVRSVGRGSTTRRGVTRYLGRRSGTSSRTRGAFHLHGAVMSFDDGFDDRQTETRSAAASGPIALSSREPLEHLRQVVRRDPVAVVGDLEHERPACGARGQRDPPTFHRRVHRVLVGASNAAPKRSLSATTTPDALVADAPSRSGGWSPSTDGLGLKRLDAHLIERKGIRDGPHRRYQQSVGEFRETSHLVEDHVDVPHRLLIPRRLTDQLGMTPCHRDGRAQFVGRVADELALAIQDPTLGLRRSARLFHRALPAVRVPRHGQEHGGHQRYLRQLGDVLLTAFDRPAERDRRRDDHGAEHDARRPGLPDPVSVEQGEAHPDRSGRNRLPAGDDEHERDVGGREQAPRDLEPMLTHRIGIPRFGSSRSDPPRASPGAGRHRHPPRCCPDRTRIPRRRPAAPFACRRRPRAASSGTPGASNSRSVKTTGP